jgi:hypothetical protein
VLLAGGSLYVVPEVRLLFDNLRFSVTDSCAFVLNQPLGSFEVYRAPLLRVVLL